MRYTVTWTRNATNDLARIWVQAADRQAVTIASNADLGGDRCLDVSPLMVFFQVIPDDRIVRVLNVWYMP